MGYCPHCLNATKEVDKYADLSTGKMVSVHYCPSCHQNSYSHSPITDTALLAKCREYREREKHEELQRYRENREAEQSEQEWKAKYARMQDRW